MLKVYELRAEYIGFSFVTLAATDEGYSLYKRNYFEDLEEGLHFSFKDDEKGRSALDKFMEGVKNEIRN